MEIFTKDHKVIYLIRSNYNLLPVINRFGIMLGFKDKSIEELCEEKKINTEFFLAIVNTYHNEEYFPEDQFLSFSPVLIVQYLKKTHQYYIKYVLPKIETLLEQLVSGCESNCKELDMIDAFYKKYKKELLLHIKEEEENVFPYVLNLIENKHSALPKYTIHSFEKEHSNVDIKLNDLKNLIIKYLEPVYDENICNEFLISLLRFEKDIKDHARIEDKILIPQVNTIERDLKG